MRLDQLGVLTVGTLVPKEVDTPCFTAPCLSFPPGLESHGSSLALQGHNIRAYPVQHVVNTPMILWGILRPKPHLRYRTGSETPQQI